MFSSEYVILYLVLVGVPIVAVSVVLWLLYATLMILPDQKKARPTTAYTKRQLKKAKDKNL